MPVNSVVCSLVCGGVRWCDACEQCICCTQEMIKQSDRVSPDKERLGDALDDMQVSASP